MFGQQDQDVDVGVRKELAAAIAADGKQRKLRGQFRFAPDTADDAIDEARVLAEQPRRVGAREERIAQRLAAALQFVAPERHAHRHARGADAVGGVCGGERRRGRHGFGDQVTGGGGGAPADVVSTSTPESVTRTVCSHCAESE